MLSTTVNGIPSSKGLSSLLEKVNLVSDTILKDLNCIDDTDTAEFQEKLADLTPKTAKKVRQEVQTNGSGVITRENREKMKFAIIAQASEAMVNSYENCTLNGESALSINEKVVKSILMKHILVSYDHPQMMELLELFPILFRELLDQLDCETGDLSTKEFDTVYFAAASTAKLDESPMWDSKDLNVIAEEISKLTKQLLQAWLIIKYCILFLIQYMKRPSCQAV